MRPIRRLLPSLLALVVGVTGLQAQGATDRVTLYGRVIDAETGSPVAGAEVRLGEALVITDGQGLFTFPPLPVGSYQIHIEHLGYGVFTEPLELTPPSVSLRVRISASAIQLEPIVVTLPGGEAYRERSRGSAGNVVTREEIARMQGTGTDLAQVLSRSITGINVRQGTQMGAPVCVEFRSMRTLQGSGCHEPMVLMDGVRVSAPRYLYTSLPLEDVERMELIPPGEAGAQYGTDTSFGVLLITTRTATNVMGETAVGSGERVPVGLYSWSLEGRPYRWERVFLTSALANAAGLALGVAVGRGCLSFDGLSDHFFESACGTTRTVGSRLALISLPLMATTFGARWAGNTDLSRGRWAQTMLGTAIVGLPGYILAASGEAEAFPGADWTGTAMLVIGMPAVATLADRLFRTVRQP